MDYCLREATFGLSQSYNQGSRREDGREPIYSIQLCSNKSITCSNRTQALLSDEELVNWWHPQTQFPQEADIVGIWNALNMDNSGRKRGLPIDSYTPCYHVRINRQE